MDEALKNICQALKEEADAVMSYTDKMTAIEQMGNMEETVQTLGIIRLDEVEHIQNLCIELTKIVSGSKKGGYEESEVLHGAKA